MRTGFSFQLAGITRTDNADWHYANPGGAEHRMKRALHRGGDDTLNIYLTTAGVYLGWAYLPSVTEQGNSYLDGIVVDWESMLGTSDRYAGRYDKGETATHEAGHWLNLEHTFFHGCNGEGDFVDDTPYEVDADVGCPAGKDTCTAPGLDPIHNYMDYSYDTCYTEFTAGQAERMQDAWDSSGARTDDLRSRAALLAAARPSTLSRRPCRAPAAGVPRPSPARESRMRPARRARRRPRRPRPPGVRPSTYVLTAHS